MLPEYAVLDMQCCDTVTLLDKTARSLNGTEIEKQRNNKKKGQDCNKGSNGGGVLKEGSSRGCGSGANSLIRCVLHPVCSQKVEECVDYCQ